MFYKVIPRVLSKLLICTISIVLSNSCVASDYQISPVPQWVKTVVIDPSIPHSDPEDIGIDYLLSDMQTKVEPSAITYFEHRIKKVLRSESIQDIANIEIDFNPQHETVFLHNVSILRGDKIVKQNLSKNIKILQREKQLDNRVFTGEKSVLILLEDVRVGDIIDYSYSIKNYDPRRLRDFYQGIHIIYSQPIVQKSYRLLWPKDRPLTIKNHNTNKKPKVKENEYEQEYTWDFKNIDEIKVEENTPYWYIPWGWIEVATSRSWNDVATIQSQNYRTPENISKELKHFIADIQKEHKNPEDQLIAAIRFVQDEIRYMSISDQTHLPSDPSLVFQRRYGDCRDKSLLTLTILKELGIKAFPALVDTDEGKALNEIVPRYSAFNHVIVLVNLNGKSYWFDPTVSHERGDLENIAQPNYGYALVLDPKTTTLTQFPTPLPTNSSLMVYEAIDLTKGFEEPALFKVKTIYKGKEANIQREWLSTQTKEKLKEKYLNYYKESYASIAAMDGFKIEDDLKKNEITMLENYKIMKPGESVSGEGKGNNKLVLWYYVNELRSYYRDNITLPRLMPISVLHPSLFIKNIEIRLPESEWDLVPEKIMVKDSSFTFMKSTQFDKNKYSIFYQYVSHDDHVKPEKASEYNDNVTKLKNEWSGGINNGSESNDSINWPVLVLTLLLTIICSVACFKVYFYKLKKKVDVPADPQYQGIRGWLIIPAISLSITPLIAIKQIVESFPIAYSMNTWSLLSNASIAGYHPLKATYLLTILYVMIAECILSALLLFLFFKKKRIFPLLFISYIWVDIILVLFMERANQALLNEPLSSLPQSIGMIIGSIIWTVYFLKSKRVKATFIEE